MSSSVVGIATLVTGGMESNVVSSLSVLDLLLGVAQPPAGADYAYQVTWHQILATQYQQGAAQRRCVYYRRHKSRPNSWVSSTVSTGAERGSCLLMQAEKHDCILAASMAEHTVEETTYLDRYLANAKHAALVNHIDADLPKDGGTAVASSRLQPYPSPDVMVGNTMLCGLSAIYHMFADLRGIPALARLRSQECGDLLECFAVTTSRVCHDTDDPDRRSHHGRCI